MFVTMYFQGARFLGALATDITVGLDSWVETNGQHQRAEEKVTVTSQDQLEVLRSAMPKFEKIIDMI